MMESLKDLLAGLLASKKFAAFAASLFAMLLVSLSSKLGLDISPDQADAMSLKVVALGSAYLIGQGVADHGKEAALVNAGLALAAEEESA